MRKRRVRIVPAVGSFLVLVVANLSAVANAGPGVWTSTGPYGGDVRALAINPANPATLYAGTFGGGVFKSADSGATWAVANAGTYNYGSGLTNLAINALAINPSNPATIYAGTNSGVFKSTDSGGTWVAASMGLNPYFIVYALAIDPATSGTLFAGTEGGGVFKSTDAGSTWAAANTGLSDQVVKALAINPLSPTTIYAGTVYGRGGLFKSTDSGGTWVNAKTGLGSLNVLAVAISPATPSTLYAGTWGGGVFKSTDSGGTWAGANTGLTEPYVNSLAINPATPSTLYAASSGGVFKSTDSGATWAAANTGVSAPYGPSVQSLAVSPATPATLYAGTYVGVFKSNNSGSDWVSTNAGMNSLNITELAINPSTPATLFAAANGAVFRSTDSGRTWVSANAGLTGVWWVATLAIDSTSPTKLYAASYGAVFKSTDSGGTWSATGPALPVSGVNTLAIDPVTPATLYAGTDGGGVYKSTDSGGTWTAANVGLGDWYIKALAINPATPATLYAGTKGGVFKSPDSGATWAAANAGLTNLAAYSLAINPANPATLYAGTFGGGIFKSTDSGATWAASNTELTSYVDVDALTINPVSPHTLYAGTYNYGIFKSTDDGGTWAAIKTGLPSLPVVALAIDPTGATTVYAGLHGGGLWQWTPSITGLVPIVLDVTGLAHYTSELQLTNLGATSATVKLSYTGSIGSGSGDVLETISPGQQVVYPDAISYLRSQNVAIPTVGSQGGTLLLSAPTGGIHATVRTGADTVAPQPVGRSGLAYTDTDPAASSSTTKMYVHGLRTSDADRSNLAVFNMGQDPVSLKVTLVSGDDGSSFEVTAGVPLVLPAYGWYQYSGVLNVAGFSSGYAIVERMGGGGPFGAYGVVNDLMTNDGSFIPAQPGTLSASKLTIPVLVETGTFESELILTNRGSATATFTLRYFESISPAKGPGGTVTVNVAAGRQMVIPKAIDFLRSNGISIGARGEASYAGILQVQVSGVGLENVFAGARTSSLSLAGGEFGVFYPGIGSSQEFSELAFLLGLKADVNNRSNVAVLHTGDGTSGPITLELQVLDGSEGGKAVGQPLSVNLNPGEWAQPSGFFTNGGVPNGYVRIRRTAGTAPWYAYGVINDGGQPGQRTGDGSYVPGVQP